MNALDALAADPAHLAGLEAAAYQAPRSIWLAKGIGQRDPELPFSCGSEPSLTACSLQNRLSSFLTVSGIFPTAFTHASQPVLAFGARCRDVDVRPSLSSIGDCYDNAMCESFFATLECELLDRRRFATKAEARTDVFHFIEGGYSVC